MPMDNIYIYIYLLSKWKNWVHSYIKVKVDVSHALVRMLWVHLNAFVFARVRYFTQLGCNKHLNAVCWRDVLC